MDLSRIPEPLRSRLEDQLSRLPSEVRATLESKLANLPMNQIEAVLQRTAPLLEKLAGHKAGGHGASSAGHSSAGNASVSATTGKPRQTGIGKASTTGSTTGQAPMSMSVFEQHKHYNNTIQRGDRDSPPFFVILFVIACALGFASTFGWI